MTANHHSKERLTVSGRLAVSATNYAIVAWQDAEGAALGQWSTAQYKHTTF